MSYTLFASRLFSRPCATPLVYGRVHAVQVACGSAHALAVDIFGHVYGRGSNRYGQLGLFVPEGGAWFVDTEQKKPSASAKHCVFPPRLLPSISRIRIVKVPGSSRGSTE